MTDTVSCRREQDFPVEEFRRVLAESGLGAIRPVAEPERLERMLAGAGLVMVARLGGEAVGVARCITDAAWCCYLSDLAVSPKAQGLGVGRLLVEAVRDEIGPEVALILVSVPEATGFYERIGMADAGPAFWFKRAK